MSDYQFKGAIAVAEPLEQGVESTWSTGLPAFESIGKSISHKPMLSGPIYRREIRYGDRCFVLSEPIYIDQRYEGGAWICRFEPLGILAYGSSFEEAYGAFQMEFACCWDEIACEDDTHLTEDAKELKRKLCDLVTKVESVE